VQPLGITREGLRCHLEGEHRERIAERTDRTRQRLAAHAAHPGGGCDFVAVLAGRAIVGFTAPFVEARGRRRVGALYVLPSAQGSGIGHALLERNLAWHGDDRDVYLTVAAYNERPGGSTRGTVSWSPGPRPGTSWSSTVRRCRNGKCCGGVGPLGWLSLGTVDPSVTHVT
jgi:GNAT superfamily N-acetyltransferase